MSILDFALWIQSTSFFTELRLSSDVYPIILSLHLTGMGLFGGMILMTDLRILGVTLRKYSVADVVTGLRRLKQAGFVLVATCGILMLGSKAEEYYFNAFFRAKLTLLILAAVHALVFRHSVYDKLGEITPDAEVPTRAKVAAGLSLVLWLSIMIMGRGIGYINPPADVHAEVRPMIVQADATR